MAPELIENWLIPIINDRELFYYNIFTELVDLIAPVGEKPQISVFFGHESDERDELVELSKHVVIKESAVANYWN